MLHICNMRLLASQCHCRQCPLEIGSAWAERVGQGEVGGFTSTQSVKTVWLLLDLSLPFLSSFAWMGLEISLMALWGLHFCRSSFLLSPYRRRWPRTMTNKILLIGGCGLSHKSVQDVCKGSFGRQNSRDWEYVKGPIYKMKTRIQLLKYRVPCCVSKSCQTL